jgi:putative metallohydrolase (TIGR04338 family)
MRDSQREKLYHAQRFGVDIAAAKFDTVEQVAQWYEEILSSAWAKKEWPKLAKLTRDIYGDLPRKLRPRVQINSRIQRWGGWHRGGFIEFPTGSVSRWTALHELAHWLRYISRNWREHEAGHGREYAGTLLTLVKHEFGMDIAQQLRESYVKHGVRYRSKKTLKPETLAAMRERGKQLAATHFNKRGTA